MTTMQSMYREDTPHVQEKVQRIQGIEESIDILQTRIDELRNERSRIKAELIPFRLEPSVDAIPTGVQEAPIYQFPDEILCSIFEYSLEDCHPRIRSLLLVCKRFHSVIMANPRLWARLEITGIGDLNFINEKSSSNYIVACLKRSRDMLMDIELGMDEFGDISRSINDGLYSYMKRSVWPLKHDMERGQVWNLKWTPDSVKCDELLDNAFVRLLGPNNENSLRWGSLKITFPEFYGTEVWQRLATSAPNLRSLVFDVGGGAIDVDGDWIDSGPTDLSEVRRFETYEVISISFLGFSPSKLQHLTISINSHLENLMELSSFPNIRSLNLWCQEDPSGSGSEDSESINTEPSLDLPALINLTVSGSYSFLKWVEFSLPLLDILVVETIDSFHPPPPLAPKHLHWKTGYTRPYKSKKAILKAIYSMLSLSNSIETFTVEAYYRSQALLVATHLWEKGRIQNLRYIIIGPGEGKSSIESIDVQHASVPEEDLLMEEFLESSEMSLEQSVDLDGYDSSADFD